MDRKETSVRRDSSSYLEIFHRLRHPEPHISPLSLIETSCTTLHVLSSIINGEIPNQAMSPMH